MPAVAAAMAKDLSSSSPRTRRTSKPTSPPSTRRCSRGCTPSRPSSATHRGTPVAVTEPVADYLLEAMGAKILTPFVFQSDIMNGVDPSPEDITLEDGYFTKHQVKVFCYNQQVVDALTASIRERRAERKVPVVGVYETMPTPGYDYQTLDDGRTDGDREGRRAPQVDGETVSDAARPRRRPRQRLLRGPHRPR